MTSGKSMVSATAREVASLKKDVEKLEKVYNERLEAKKLMVELVKKIRGTKEYSLLRKHQKKSDYIAEFFSLVSILKQEFDWELSDLKSEVEFEKDYLEDSIKELKFLESEKKESTSDTKVSGKRALKRGYRFGKKKRVLGRRGR